MDNLLYFYEVNLDYITYLLSVDSKVPRLDYSSTSEHDKFLCGIVLSVGGHDYFAPITSFKTPQRTNMIINNEQGAPISSIRFSFMIPVPPSIVTVKDFNAEPSLAYRRLLELELRYCRRNSRTIHRLAKYVYNTVVENRDAIMVMNCCDFKKLEAACAEYTKNLPSEDTQVDITPDVADSPKNQPE
ncbi:MAG: type III toxin-antitoxin system ToxN/AbiQ family toxin [Oscillospiraceae bacterium]|nr:type III toxin-antitoxin system ToxN/AbiQ family toxin [Oscillospiraceae bacterium]